MTSHTTESPILHDPDSLFDACEYDKALELYEELLATKPNSIEALTGKALCLFHLARFEEAVKFLQILLPFLPDSDQLKLLLAESLLQAKRTEDGRLCLEELVRKSPDNLDARLRLGKFYLDEDNYKAAYPHFVSVLKINSENSEALGYTGIVFIRFCQFDEAITVLSKAYKIDPDNALILNNLGRAFKMMGRQHDAMDWFRKAMLIEPNNACIISNYLFTLCYCEGLDPVFVAQEFFRLAPRCKPEGQQQMPVDINGKKRNRDKIRVGYVSGDFYTHSVCYFLEPVLQNHDRRKFEIFCYSVGRSHDATTDRLISLVDNWREMVAMPPVDLWQQIIKDQIDILVDLSGHTADNRLGAFSLRAAPIQVSWIGCPATTGLPEMDYYLTDHYCDPSGMTEQFFTERLCRFSRTFCCYLPPLTFPQISFSPCIRNGYITFGSFNNFAKVTQRQIKLWARILAAVPSSRLYLKSMSLGSSWVVNDVLEQFATKGVAKERLLVRGITETPQEHLGEYANVDIALDTYPYHGTTTTCEALWMGTPVITLAGNTHVSRVGVSLLENAGCPELIATSEEQYLQISVALATDLERILLYRKELRSRLATSPLMDAQGVTRELEEIYQQIYEQLDSSPGKCE